MEIHRTRAEPWRVTLLGASLATALTFGPDESDVQPVEWLVRQINQRWPGDIAWDVTPGPHSHEATYLNRDSHRAKARLGWLRTWRLDTALDAIVDWYVALRDGESPRDTTRAQIRRFASGIPNPSRSAA